MPTPLFTAYYEPLAGASPRTPGDYASRHFSALTRQIVLQRAEAKRPGGMELVKIIWHGSGGRCIWQKPGGWVEKVANRTFPPTK